MARFHKMLRNYLEVLKPRATALLTFIGFSAAIIAGAGQPPADKLFLVLITILLGSAGVNGLTNYLDRDIDARMRRTRYRVLPSKRIAPPEKALALTVFLIIIGLGLSWWLHPLSFMAGLTGTVAAIVGRKRATCVFPQGMLASCAPVLVGWFAIRPAFSWELVLLCVLIAVWLPLHVWSVMITNRDDYIGAGLTFFPMNREVREAVSVLLPFSLVLAVTAITLYFVADFGWFYLAVVSLLSVIMVYSTLRLVASKASADAWKLYKLSTYPYLGLIFLVMCLDIWLL
ncbi:MAG: UbiA family prenyltransferase [Dehalococcoidales bacterium]|nr:UbiA family prenyltransferase [Dehalococcoidales bacterium]MDZ4230632.1 UbiA family prenyltransferase [Dehalococcoidales bacterium]